MPGARSVFAERTAAGYFLDVRWRRRELARHGISLEEAQEVVAAAIGGENVTTTIEGRERYSVNVRYLPDVPGGHRVDRPRPRAGRDRPADPARAAGGRRR